MITIFECETEVGKCSYEDDGSYSYRYAEPDFASVYAHTTASLNQSRGVLRIEHHCYLRRGNELPDQPWIKPEFIFDPVRPNRRENVQFAETMHQQFIERVRNEFPQEYLV
jgi:hypothetical protein